MSPFRFSKIEQPPLVGPEWPRVIGKPLAASLGDGLARGEGWSFVLFPALTAATFWLGSKRPLFYLVSAFFAVVSAQQAFLRWQR
jgi:hypothetical protein